MISHTFTIPGRFQSLNGYLAQIKKSRWNWVKIKKEETQRCGLWAIAGNVPRFEGPVTISFRWIEENYKRDLDNIAFAQKFILDGLVQSGKIRNDGQSWVQGLSHSFGVDPENPRVEVEITGC